MNSVDLIKGRRSVRRFGKKPVTRDIITKIVDVSRYAPSWKNTQTTRYIAITDEAEKEKIADECVMGFESNQKVIKDAPCLIIILTVDERSGYERDGSFSTSKGTHWQSFDAGIAAQTFCLSAYENGLGTVIMGIYDEEKIREIIDIPSGSSVSALISLGYPAEEPRAPRRKEAEEILTFI